MASGTKSLSQVVEERCKEEEDAASGAFNHIFVKPLTGNYLERLQCMSIDHQNIDSLDGIAQLAATCPNLRDIDISHNLLTSWTEVFSLLAAFPRLRQLNVSFNPFAKPADSAAPGGDAMSEITPAAPAAAAVEHTGLKTLIVNGTFCPWTLVHTFLSQCTSVEELHLSCNEYNQIELPERCHDKLKRLHFNNNAVVSWQNLERVGAVFPALLMLVARANPLTVPVAESPASADDENTEAAADELHLAQVPFIVLSETKISTVDELRGLAHRCPGLKQLRLQSVPLFDDWPEELHRGGIIACLPQLTHLNGSSIDDDEREKAERAFIRHYTNAPNLLVGDAKEVAESLVEKHGNLLPLAEVNLGPPKGNITLNVRWDTKVHPRSNPDVHTMKLPLTTSFAAFQEKVAKRFEIDPRKVFRLKFFHYDDECGVNVLQRIATPGVRSLYDSDLADGDEIFLRL
ncbi:tubulin-specific chaperone cofactor E-like protein [Sycon ciliatum]|uniref:tubulin-specific chaperone cofactor E-like protein n=1 Tax=Sycon ciliatum TaxID=27933 RepID=UPI0031F666EB